MHFAPQDCKRFLHYDRGYVDFMDSPNQRLRVAREKLYSTAIEAADAMGIKHSTYIGHENGHRGFSAKRAGAYARKLKVSAEWLLYGKGDGPIDFLPSQEELEAMMRLALDENVTLSTRLADVPHAVAASLHSQLKAFTNDGAKAA